MPPDSHLVVKFMLSRSGIVPEAVTVLRTLLNRCANRSRLAQAILDNVVKNATDIGKERGILVIPFALREFLYMQAWVERVLAHPMPPVEACLTEAIDDEAFGWLRGFLVYRKPDVEGRLESRSISPFFSAAIGRRWQELLRWERDAADLHEADEFHPGLRPLRLERWDHVRVLAEQVNQRDGYICAATGETAGLVMTEVIPAGKQLARFRHYASLFFDGAFDQALAEGNISTTRNALCLTRDWFHFFDDGRVVLLKQFERVHVECVDHSLLDDPRFIRRGDPTNGLDEPGDGLQLILRNGAGANSLPPIDRDLLRLHRAVILAFYATGLAGRLLHAMLLVDEIPRSQLRVDRMSRTFFHGIVSHKLSLV